MVAERLFGGVGVGLRVIAIKLVSDRSDEDIDQLQGLLVFRVLELQFSVGPIGSVNLYLALGSTWRI